MISIRKMYGLVNETGSFLANPGPEASKQAAVEASDDFNKEKQWFGQRNTRLSGKSWSGGFRTCRVNPLPFRRRRDGFRTSHCYYHHFAKLLPPWPIDGCLQVAHVSPMAAKVRKSCDYSSEPLAVPAEARWFSNTSLLLSPLFQTFAAMADRWLPPSCPCVAHGGKDSQKLSF